jgi:hypothetical protein
MFRARAGQSTVETMLWISVMTVALCAAGYLLIGPLQAGFTEMRADARTVFENGQLEGANDMR